MKINLNQADIYELKANGQIARRGIGVVWTPFYETATPEPEPKKKKSMFSKVEPETENENHIL